MESGLQSEQIPFLGSIYVILPVCCSFFVGKLAGKYAFSTHKNCEKVSTKYRNIKNEFSALITSPKWYDITETYNLSHRTVHQQLLDDSETLIFLVTIGDFWINLRKLL